MVILIYPSNIHVSIVCFQYGRLQEKLFDFKGVFVQQKVLRNYTIPYGAHAIGSVGEVNRRQIEADSYYNKGDYKGQSGIEKRIRRIPERRKGVEILLHDVHGRIKGKYQNGAKGYFTQSRKRPCHVFGYESTRIWRKINEWETPGSIVAIEPSTGEILALVKSVPLAPGCGGKTRRKTTSLCKRFNQTPI